MKRQVLFAALLLCTGACSNIAYQPSKKFFYDPQKFGFSYEDIYFHSKDGTMLHGWLFPATSKGEEQGLVIQFHGNAENISTHFMSLAWMTKHGYSLFIFDYRGYGRSGGSPSPARVNDDGAAALEYAINMKNEYIKSPDKEEKQKFKLVAYGQSIGGAILLRALHDLDDKSEIDAIVAESTFLSYQEVAREKLSLSFITWPFQPLAYLLFSDKYAPKHHMDKISPIPLLIIHGNNDIIIPINHGEEMYKMAKEPKWFWKVEGGKHISAMNMKDMREKLLVFLNNL